MCFCEFAPCYVMCLYLHITNVGDGKQSIVQLSHLLQSNQSVCVYVGVDGGGEGSSLFICVRLFKSTIQRGRGRDRERESEKEDEQEKRAKGTENKWSGRKNKTGGTQREREIRWEGVEQVRKLDERSVRRPRSQSQHLIPKTAQRLGRNQPR